MMLILEVCFILVFIVTGCLSKIYRYGMDNPTVCSSDRTVLQWIIDTDTIVIHGKVDGNDYSHCEMKLGPSAQAKKQLIKVKFDSYYNNNCNVYLSVEQSPYSFFDQEVSTLFNLTCRDKPGKAVFYSEAENNIRITLHKADAKILNYNFIFNVTLTDQVESEGISTPIIVGIGVIIGIAIPGIACIVYRYLKIKRWSKRQYEHDEQSPQSLRRLTHNASPTPISMRYSSMPHGDEGLSGSIHSQICVSGSSGTNGRCTVCNRSHEDFAHVFDVDGAGHVIVDSPHRSHEAIADINDSQHNVDGHGRRPRSHTCPHRNLNINQPITGSHSRLAPPPSNHQSNHDNNTHYNQSPLATSNEGQGHVWTNGDDFDDDDMDLSSNDLIPPSYDLSPPSYDEAVSMPKPNIDAVVMAPIRSRSRADNDLETDPLYQNLDSLTT